MECLYKTSILVSQQCQQQQTASTLNVIVALCLKHQLVKLCSDRISFLGQCLSCHYSTSVMLAIYTHRIRAICNMCQTSRDSSDLAGFATESQNI